MESQNELTIIEQKARRRKITQNTVIYALLTIWGLCVLFPFYWMVLSSVKSYSEYSSEYVPKFYTAAPTMQNYIDAFTAVNLGRYLLNTLLFTLITTGVMLVVTILAAYAFARIEFAGRELVFLIFTHDDPERARYHHELCYHYEFGYEEYLCRSDPAVDYFGILYLPAA